MFQLLVDVIELKVNCELVILEKWDNEIKVSIWMQNLSNEKIEVVKQEHKKGSQGDLFRVRRWNSNSRGLCFVPSKLR